MGIAFDTAQQVSSDFQLTYPATEDQLDIILETKHIRLLHFSPHLPIREFRRGKIIGIRSDQSLPWRKWLKAHALGHYLMHAGDQLQLDGWRFRRQERQAEQFAGSLLLSDTWDKMLPWELAEYHVLPQERIERWISLEVGEGVVSARW
jgi:hypothetical protein